MTNILENLQQVKHNLDVSSGVFDFREDAMYYIAKVNECGNIISEEYFDALTKFRADTYLHLGFIATSDVDEKGRDIDIDESRSTSFIVIKKNNNTLDGPSVVGSGRLIYKGSPDRPLPIEQYFPECFEDGPLSNNTVEVSRFISRDPAEINRHMVSLAIIRSLLFEAFEHNIDDSYCIIEKPLLKLLNNIGIPTEVIDEPKDIPNQGGTLYPIEINPYRVLESVKSDKYKIINLKSFFDDKNRGVGYYSSNLDGVKDE